MKTTVSLLLALALPLTAAAQAPADTATTYKHQLGLTASPVLDGFFKNNRSLPLGLLYKRQLTPNKALRLRLVGQYSQADTANFQDTAPGFTRGYVTGPDQSRWGLQGFAGYEWQRFLSRKVGLAYGIEAGIGYERQRIASAFIEAYVIEGSVTTSREAITQNWQFQARPFVGLYYQPTSRLRLFVESAFAISYIRSRWERQSRSKFTKPNEADRFLQERAHTNRFAATLRPVQFIGATYAF
ncbi:hypothetical protein [Hymenobacter yonginensis]|uniref:Outer membrane protein beta-barrel domain-containing protein n=1 Tax=Hymenobacter yonginensis TaxID=748197 RepID=A0ABY7PP18_9BACT|nr:hypothetical protein [Hymenobacter yonginensis]WBO84280.1 hypothetical protein O9Z63_18150 [Hymenobacter yonginensis]